MPLSAYSAVTPGSVSFRVPQCGCYPPYLCEALTWSNPFKLTLFFPSQDVHSHKFSIAFSSCWNLHPFFSRPLTSMMHFDDNLKNGGPSTTAVMIPTRTHPSPIAAITNPPIFPQNPLARRQANDPRLCGYINGDPGTPPCPPPPPPHLTPTAASSIKCSGQFGCAPRRHRQPPLLRLLRLQHLPGHGRDVRRPRHQHVHRRQQQHLLPGLLEHGPDPVVSHRLRHPRPPADGHAGRRLHVVVVRRRSGDGDGAADDGQGGCCQSDGGEQGQWGWDGVRGVELRSHRWVLYVGWQRGCVVRRARGWDRWGWAVEHGGECWYGIIAGVILGVLLLLGLAGCLFWRYRRTRRRREEQRARHEAHTKAFTLRDPGGNSEALMGSTQTMTWLMHQQGDDRMTVIL